MQSGRKFADFIINERKSEAHFSFGYKSETEKNYSFSYGFHILLEERRVEIISCNITKDVIRCSMQK